MRLRRLAGLIVFISMVADAGPDPDFMADGYFLLKGQSLFFVLDLSLDSEERLVVAGTAFGLGGYSFVQQFVARYHSTGQPDLAFGVGGSRAVRFGSGSNVALIGGGHVVIRPNAMIQLFASPHVGADFDIATARLLPDGSMDQGFGVRGKATFNIGPLTSEYSIARLLLPDGRLLVSGASFSLGAALITPILVRFNEDGGLDQTFGSNGNAVPNVAGTGRDVLMSSTGSLLQVLAPAAGHMGFARYSASGQLDGSFGTAGVRIYEWEPNTKQISVRTFMTNSGKLLCVGVHKDGVRQDIYLARFIGEGADLDPNFGTGGRILLDIENQEDQVLNAALDHQGRLVVLGKTGPFGAQAMFLARFLETGALDPSFGTLGIEKPALNISKNLSGGSLAIRRDGKILVSGHAQTSFIARFREDGKLDA